MAVLLLLLLLLLSNLTLVLSQASTAPKGVCQAGLDQPVTILSIDGGGVRGIIPAVLLRHLEQALRDLDGEDARLADYFDFVAGTSTGGLIATMLSTPDDNGRPMFSTEDIMDFYVQHSRDIFPVSNLPFKRLYLTKFNGVELHHIVRSTLKETRIADSLTNLIIPTYDIHSMKPVIFTTLKAHKYPLMNVKNSDLCLGTTAAPTYFPPYYFQNQHGHHTREFHLVDGGVIANNPTMLAFLEATQHMHRSSQSRKIVLLSLGTGMANKTGYYDARRLERAGIKGWYISGALETLVANQQLVDQYYFKEVVGLSNYDVDMTRIQELNLRPTQAELDVSTEENLSSLIQVAYKLLDKEAEKLNEGNSITNEEALGLLASILHNRRVKSCETH